MKYMSEQVVVLLEALWLESALKFWLYFRWPGEIFQAAGDNMELPSKCFFMLPKYLVLNDIIELFTTISHKHHLKVWNPCFIPSLHFCYYFDICFWRHCLCSKISREKYSNKKVTSKSRNIRNLHIE